LAGALFRRHASPPFQLWTIFFLAVYLVKKRFYQDPLLYMNPFLNQLASLAISCSRLLKDGLPPTPLVSLLVLASCLRSCVVSVLFSLIAKSASLKPFVIIYFLHPAGFPLGLPTDPSTVSLELPLPPGDANFMSLHQILACERGIGEEPC